MSNIDKQALRQTAEKAQEHGVFNMDIHSQTVLALLDELAFLDRRNAELNSTLERWAVDRAQSTSELEAAEKRIAELEARELVVNLPAYVDGRTLGYGEVNHMIDLCVDAFERACHSAGINLTVEG